MGADATGFEAPNSVERSARYYKSVGGEDQIIHVQYADHWENLGPSGHVLASSRREFPQASLAQYEEINPAEAFRILHASSVSSVDEEGFVSRKALKGIRGWLILPLVGLPITAALGIYATVRYLQRLSQEGEWSRWLGIGTESYHPARGAWIVYGMSVTAVIVVAAVALLVLLLLKRRAFRKLMVGFLIGVFVLRIGDAVFFFIVDGAVNPYFELEKGGQIASLFSSAAGTFLWVAYYLTSVRVKNTFVNPPTMELS